MESAPGQEGKDQDPMECLGRVREVLEDAVCAAMCLWLEKRGKDIRGRWRWGGEVCHAGMMTSDQLQERAFWD